MSTRWLLLGITSSTSTPTIVASDRPWMKTPSSAGYVETIVCVRSGHIHHIPLVLLLIFARRPQS